MVQKIRDSRKFSLTRNICIPPTPPKAQGSLWKRERKDRREPEVVGDYKKTMSLDTAEQLHMCAPVATDSMHKAVYDLKLDQIQHEKGAGH